MAGEEGDGAAQETDDRCCFFVGQDLGVGEPAVVVDRDMDELPASLVGAAVMTCARDPAGNAMPGASDPAPLLHVDVDELAPPGAPLADRPPGPPPAPLSPTRPAPEPPD